MANMSAVFKRLFPEIAGISLLFACAMVASSPLLSEGWFKSHDYQCHLERLFAVSYEISLGHYYPRWLSTAAFGKGAPVLNYYSPGFYLLAGYLNNLGLPLLLAVKTLCISLFFAGAWGMFLWTRRYCGYIGALLAAIIYMYVPYHFLDIYVRGDMPEFAVLALVPFLFLGIDLSLSGERVFGGILLTGAISAAIVLIHNLSAILIGPFGIIYFFCTAYLLKTPLKTILLSALSTVVGAGLSAFHWLPFFAEADYLRDLRSTVVADPAAHFVYPFQWFALHWGFGPSVPGPGDTMSFQIGLVLFFFVSVAILSLLFSPARTGKFGILALVLGVFGLFLTMSFSAHLYTFMTMFRYVQFPWRFLGPATVFLSAFSGLSVNLRAIRGLSMAPLLMLFVASVLCLVLSDIQRTVDEKIPGSITSIKQIDPDSSNIALLGDDDEFLPKWAGSQKVVEAKIASIYVPDTSIAKIENVEMKGPSLHFDASVSRTSFSPVTVGWFYFPGWELLIDGRHAEITYSKDGLIVFDIPAGRHSIHLSFGTTWPRTAGWIVAAITVLFLFFFRISPISLAGIPLSRRQKRASCSPPGRNT